MTGDDGGHGHCGHVLDPFAVSYVPDIVVLL